MADIKISIKSDTTGESYQRALSNFSIDNNKFIIKCQAEFL